MDIVRDILDRVPVADKKLLAQIEQDIRRDYGGERVYVPKDGDKAQTEISMRNAAIRADYRRGESVALLIRRYRISRQRVHQIVKDLP